MLTRTALIALALAAGAERNLFAQSYIPPMTDEQAAEARSTLADMKTAERGPYLRIRWFCNDGTVQPPQGAPCRERGGGSQHAEYNDAAKGLAELGLHVGTILRATSFEELSDAAHAHDWLKQLVLEHFLVQVDDGWVLRRARFYRGARQAEDEEESGTVFLERLLSDAQWVRDHYWLTMQLVATVPHLGPGGPRLVQRVRNLATEAADLDPGFLRLRIKIHSFPSEADIAGVERYLAGSASSSGARAKLEELLDALRRYYDRRTRLENLAAFESSVDDIAVLGDALRGAREALEAGLTRDAFELTAELSSRIRSLLLASADGRRNLVLADLNLALQEQAITLGAELERSDRPRSRRTRILELAPYFALAEGAGFLSERERRALVGQAAELARRSSPPALEYRGDLAYMARSLDWAAATVRSYMSPTLERYTRVEPKAAGFLDATVRGSILLPLSNSLARLGADADAALGAAHVLLGEPGGPDVRGLNPGMAEGTLEIASLESLEELDASTIYLLPETTAELRPVAGVLSLDAGNLLSHVQLLARNLGIPNATIPSRTRRLVEDARGRTVFYAVSPLGRVVLKDTASLDPVERGLLRDRAATPATRLRLDTSRLRLEVDGPIPLTDLRADDSGVLVGPKAANLGELRAMFPDRVAPGLALPFGTFRRHLDRPFEGEGTVLGELVGFYREAARLEAAGRSQEEVDRFMLDRLAYVRRAIVELEWLPEVRQRIVSAIREVFGSDLSAGIFVRSDTNVEDLPQFSGAGLNLTVPNQRSEEDILAAIKRVWTSPFSERAYLWRRQILEDQGRVYPSVLLLRSVASEKSGVLITSGLQYGTPDDLTIATAEGVGGAVDGEDTETVVVAADGAVRLLSQAKAPTRRVLAADGGAVRIPARRPEYLLEPRDIGQLRDVVRRWKRDFNDPTPQRIWDIEFGFVDGHLWLFQVRPFIRFRGSELLERLSVLDAQALRNADRPVSLEEAI